MRARSLAAIVLALAAAVPAFAADAALPARPEKIAFRPFQFDVPKAAKFRNTLKVGNAVIPVYVAEDHSLPLVNIGFTMRAGSFLEPADKVGLASLTGTMMRKGGAGSRTPIEFDERADFLAANVSGFVGDTQAGVSLNALSYNLQPSLDLLFDMLTAPRFEQDRLDIEKGNELEAMKQRNDDAGDIADREWDWLMNGSQHYASRPHTKKHVDAVTREDLVKFHQAAVRPENIAVIAISGDVDTKTILAELGKRLGAWKPGTPATKIPWPPQGPNHTPKPGLYHVEKDIPQGKVYIGHEGTTWKDPDQMQVMVMNYVLGGGGFTSRIMKKVRSDEGLAYSAGSMFGIGTWWPDDFRIYYQSKSSTVALAAKLSIDEMSRIRTQAISQDELDGAKNYFVESFPRRFENPAAIANLYANDEFIGRDHAYWEQYQANMRKITVADVQRVAQKHLDPAKLVFLVVGKWADIEQGDPGKRASMKDFFGGQVTHLPLRDPFTLEPLP